MPPTAPIRLLRRTAIAHAFRHARTADEAIDRLGFLQLDPLRAPARTQDLVLRHRVTAYREGGLARALPTLAVEEDALHVYGVLPRSVWSLLHPRLDTRGRPWAPTGLEADVLALVQALGRERAVHPRTVAQQLGEHRERNGWGGHSRATTRALERLHFHGLLRVAAREQGVRCYAPAHAVPAPPGDERDRLDALVLVLASLYAPVPERTLRELLGMMLRFGASHLRRVAGRDRGAAISRLLEAGRLEPLDVDGQRYLQPVSADARAPRAVSARIRFLSPFDPLVWDRRRFEHLWGWPYRLEAYTPAARRRYGHYALPLLWRDDMVGWVNATVTDGTLDIRTGFAARRPRDAAFRRAFDAEVARLERFLQR